MTRRVRSHILESEALCDDGCGLMAHYVALDNANLFIESCGFPIGISCLVRCEDYNALIGGADDSPHLPVDPPLWGGDFRQRNPEKRMVMIRKALAMRELGLVNHIEVADHHVHLALVPDDHRFADLFHWGKSK